MSSLKIGKIATILACLSFFVCTISVFPAQAQSKDPEKLIEEGDRLYEEGRYEEASELYDEAYYLAARQTTPLPEGQVLPER
jgi:outer membrane protein assembly factor BamD (BamD/ComL family)